MFLFFGAVILGSFVSAFTFESPWILLLPAVMLVAFAGWLTPSLLFYMLLLTIPFSFEYHVNASLGTDIPDEPLMLLTAFLFLAFLLYRPKSIPSETLRHPLLLILVCSFCWTLTTTIVSGHGLLSLKFLLAKSWYLGAFLLAPLILFRDLRSILLAAKLLFGSMAIVTIVILLRHGGMGFQFATINDAVFPFFRNHVNYSAMLVCLLPIGFFFYKHSRKNTARLLLPVLLLILLPATYFTYSRGAWLALIIGVIAAWLVKRRLLVLSYIVFLIITIAAIFYLKSNDRYLRYAPDFKSTVFHKNFEEHIIATYQLKDVSTAERFYRWIAGVRMIKDNWLTGYGPNSFYEEYKPYAVPLYKTWVSSNSDHSTVHNYFLLTAVEQGLPGLFFLLLLFGALFYYAQQITIRAQDPLIRSAATCLAVIATMLFVLNFLSDLVETDKIGSLFFLTIAALISLDRLSRHQQQLQMNNA